MVVNQRENKLWEKIGIQNNLKNICQQTCRHVVQAKRWQTAVIQLLQKLQEMFPELEKEPVSNCSWYLVSVASRICSVVNVASNHLVPYYSYYRVPHIVPR